MTIGPAEQVNATLFEWEMFLMRTWVIVLVFAVLGAAAGLGGTILELGLSPEREETALEIEEAGSKPLPKVVVDHLEHDFGTMPRDAAGQHTFIIRNEGTAPLTLNKLSTSCKCTLGSFVRGQIPPGEATTATLEWTARTDAGFFRQTATIETNDPRRSQLTLAVSGKVVDSLRIVPEQVVLNGVLASAEKTAEISMYATHSADFKILGHTLSDPSNSAHFEVAVDAIPTEELAAEEAKSGQRVQVKIKPGLPLGLVKQTIRLDTNLPERPVIDVPVDVNVRGDISISGPAALWNAQSNILTLGDHGSVKASQGAKGGVTLIVRGLDHTRVAFRVEAVEPEMLRVEVSPPKLGKTTTTAQLTVEVPKGMRPVNHLGSQQGKLGRITLATGHPQSPKLRLFVKFVVED